MRCTSKKVPESHFYLDCEPQCSNVLRVVLSRAQRLESGHGRKSYSTEKLWWQAEKSEKRLPEEKVFEKLAENDPYASTELN